MIPISYYNNKLVYYFIHIFTIVCFGMIGLQYICPFLFNRKIFQPLYSLLIWLLFFVIVKKDFGSKEEKRLIKFILFCHYILSILYLFTFMAESYECHLQSVKNKQERNKKELKKQIV